MPYNWLSNAPVHHPDHSLYIHLKTLTVSADEVAKHDRILILINWPRSLSHVAQGTPKQSECKRPLSQSSCIVPHCVGQCPAHEPRPLETWRTRKCLVNSKSFHYGRGSDVTGLRLYAK